jgi:hypothetical protein
MPDPAIHRQRLLRGEYNDEAIHLSFPLRRGNPVTGIQMDSRHYTTGSRIVVRDMDRRAKALPFLEMTRYPYKHCYNKL